MPTDVLAELKDAVRKIGRNYPDRFHRARRLFVEERPAALAQSREIEYEIKSTISEELKVPYSSVCFSGSSQLGFSVHKDRLFELASSDLDIACVNGSLYQHAWSDIMATTRAFTDITPFTGYTWYDIERLKDNILRRGMIKIDLMPRSKLSNGWRDFQNKLGRRYVEFFGSISIAIYMSEYAFCWKQDTSLTQLIDWG